MPPAANLRETDLHLPAIRHLPTDLHVRRSRRRDARHGRGGRAMGGQAAAHAGCQDVVGHVPQAGGLLGGRVSLCFLLPGLRLRCVLARPCAFTVLPPPHAACSLSHCTTRDTCVARALRICARLCAALTRCLIIKINLPCRVRSACARVQARSKAGLRTSPMTTGPAASTALAAPSAARASTRAASRTVRATRDRTRDAIPMARC